MTAKIVLVQIVAWVLSPFSLVTARIAHGALLLHVR